MKKFDTDDSTSYSNLHIPHYTVTITNSTSKEQKVYKTIFYEENIMKEAVITLLWENHDN